jgi:hypothetical protein
MNSGGEKQNGLLEVSILNMWASPRQYYCAADGGHYKY